MLSKINLKQLLLILVILIGVLWMSNYRSQKKGDRTFKTELVSFNTDDVTKITVFPKEDPQNPYSAFLDGENWKISQGGKTYNAASGIHNNFLRALTSLNPERLAALNKKSWDKFEVGDSASTRVVVYAGEKTLADVIIGKFSYTIPQTQQNIQMQQMGQQPRGKMTSFVRLNGEKEVYAVNGYISMTFDRNIDYFRNQYLITGNTNAWTKITVKHPGDSSYVLEKVNKYWVLNNAPTDSLSSLSFINSLRDLQSRHFTDNEPTSTTHELTIEGDKLEEPIVVTAQEKDGKYILKSTQNPNTYWESEQYDVFKKLFATRPKLAE